MGEIGRRCFRHSQVLLAGSFGALPDAAQRRPYRPCARIALPRIVSAGNVAGEGAKIAALSLRERAEAQSILREVGVRRAVGPRGLQRPCSSTSWRPRDDRALPARRAAVRLRRARLRHARHRPAPRLDIESCRCPALLHNRPSGSRSRRPRSWGPDGSRSRTATAAVTAQSTRGRAGRPPGELLRHVRARGGPRGASSRSRERTSSPTSWRGRSCTPWCASSGSTAGPSCATPISADYRRVVWLAQRPPPPPVRGGRAARGRSAAGGDPRRHRRPGARLQARPAT